MDQEYGKLISKFFNKSNQKFVIPLGNQQLVFGRDIIDAVKFNMHMNHVRSVCTGSSLMASLIEPNYSCEVKYKAAQKIGEIYFSSYIEIILQYIATYGIYDLSEDDFLHSTGGENSTILNSKGEFRESHISPIADYMKAINKQINDIRERGGDIKKDKRTSVLMGLTISSSLLTGLDNIKDDARFILEDKPYFAQEAKRKCNAIINNLEKGRIPESGKLTALCQAFQINPFELKLYDVEGIAINEQDLNEIKKFFMMEQSTNKDYMEMLTTSVAIAGSIWMEEPDEYLKDKARIDDIVKLGIINKYIDETIIDKIQIKKILHTTEVELEKENINLSNTNKSIDGTTNNFGNNSLFEEKSFNLMGFVSALSNKFAIEGVYYRNRSAKDDEKISKALQAYGEVLPQSDVVIACYDDTLFGGADDGCILTTNGMAIHNIGDSALYISYRDIQTMTVKERYIYFNDKKLEAGTMKNAGQASFCELIATISNTIGDKPSTNNEKQGQMHENCIVCQNCGKELAADSHFCTVCGTPV